MRCRYCSICIFGEEVIEITGHSCIDGAVELLEPGSKTGLVDRATTSCGVLLRMPGSIHAVPPINGGIWVSWEERGGDGEGGEVKRLLSASQARSTKQKHEAGLKVWKEYLIHDRYQVKDLNLLCTGSCRRAVSLKRKAFDAISLFLSNNC